MNRLLSFFLIIATNIFLIMNSLINPNSSVYAGEIRSYIVSPEEINKLEKKGFIDGYQRAKLDLPEYIEAGLEKREIVETIKQKIYADAYLRGYIQFEIDLGEYMGINESEFYLQNIAFKDGCLRAKSGLNEFPEIGMDKLELEELRKQLIYLDAYHQGYARWQFTYSCFPSPYN